MHGRRSRTQPARELTSKRRRTSQRGGSRSSSTNGESSTAEVRTTQQPLQQRPSSPTTNSAGSTVANPMPTIPIQPSQSVRDLGDQIAPTSPRPIKKKIYYASKVQVVQDKPAVDLLLQQQLSSSPKESFCLCNSDFMW